MPQIEIHTHVQRQGVTQRYEQTLALSHIRKLRDKNNATQAQTHRRTHTHTKSLHSGRVTVWYSIA